MLAGVATSANKTSYDNKLEKLHEKVYETLKEYNEANEKFSEFRSKDSSDSFWTGFCNVIGFATIIVALIWMIIKKLAFNKDGETFFDIPDRDMCTVDSCHPNDLGMYLIANKVTEVLGGILNGGNA